MLPFKLDLLNLHYQNRGKFFWHSEVVNFDQSNPLKNPVDPLWSYTQSGKNYQPSVDFWILKNYTRPHFFQLTQDNYGYASGLVRLKTSPLWAHPIFTNQWYWRQKKAVKMSKWLYALPGVKGVYLSGSAALEICKNSSDLDFAIQTQTHSFLIARFWCLVYFKFYNWKNQTSYRPDRKPKDIRADFGLIYSQEILVKEYFGQDERLWFVLGKMLVAKNSAQLQQLSKPIDCIYFLEDGWLVVWSQRILKFLLWAISLPLYPLLSLQLFWYKIRKGSQFPDEYLSRDFCCFYPRLARPPKKIDIPI